MSAGQKKVIDDHCTNEWAGKVAAPWADFEHACVAEAEEPIRRHEVYPLTTEQSADGARPPAAAEGVGQQRQESERRPRCDHEGVAGRPDQIPGGLLIDASASGGVEARRLSRRTFAPPWPHLVAKPTIGRGLRPPNTAAWTPSDRIELTAASSSASSRPTYSSPSCCATSASTFPAATTSPASARHPHLLGHRRHVLSRHPHHGRPRVGQRRPALSAHDRHLCHARAAVRRHRADLDPVRQGRSTYSYNVQTFELRLPTWPFFLVAWLGDVSAVLLIAVRTYG